MSAPFVEKTVLFLFFINLFIYLFLAALGLRCCTLAFCRCGERGLLFVEEARASHCSGVFCGGARALGVRPSVVVARGLQSAGSVVVAHGLSCSAACGIFPDQGSNPCPLHQQADSQPLRHQGSPVLFLLNGLGTLVENQNDHAHEGLEGQILVLNSG